MNTTLVIVFIVCLVFSVGFLMLVITLIPAIQQLKVLLKDLTRTSEEVRELSLRLQQTNDQVRQDIEGVEEIIQSSRETVNTVKNSLHTINRSFIKKSAGFLAFLPALKYGWNLARKIKGGNKHVR